MEIGFHALIPTYSGGLGVLAGDTVRSAADLCVPMVAVTPVHRKGYFVQEIDGGGQQHEQPAVWSVSEQLEPVAPVVCVQIERRNVLVRAWRYSVKGVSGAVVPVLLLDTDVPENHPADRTLTDHLYGGDHRYRLAQEAILGIGGLRMLRALGYNHIDRFHLNEGHAALLTMELLNERIASRGDNAPTMDDVQAVRRQCVFTTHTPVPAGHDRFPLDLVEHVLGRQDALHAQIGALANGELNMTALAMSLSNFTNAVSRRHAEVSRDMFPDHPIEFITNGVHGATWTSEPFAALFDRAIDCWRHDNLSLRHALGIARQDIWQAHVQAKRMLMDYANRYADGRLNADAFTLGFARRAATYKRADLLVSDVQRLKTMASQHGPMQIIYAGKAHPRDGGGKDIIRRVHESLARLRPEITAVYLPNYEMPLGRLLTAGVDVWVNTPQRPLEASGTSGMKSALNGVPSLSVLDGWWVEGCTENVTGWAIESNGNRPDESHDWHSDAARLYDKLQNVILPLYYRDRDGFIDVMRHAIAINGAHFNTQRMVQEYVVKAYCR